VNGDTRLDLVVANETAGNLQLFHGSAGGLFTTPALFLASGATPSAVAIADFDGDTFQDVVATMAGSSSLVLYKSFGNAGIFSLADSEYVPAPQAVALGDVLMDGRVDVVVAAQGASQAYVLTQARPLPSASDANFSFNAPSGTRMFIAARSAYQMGTDWDYTSRGMAGANSFSFPLASTLAPSRPAPSNQAVSWSMGTYTFPAGAPFNYDNFRWPFIRSLGGADGFGQTQGHAYIRP
jgi:hypothetical protein